ncbi:MAG: ABC transporter permease [Brachymonas sp.]|nr:ABC transporter permease [Brachymonas sp.]
MLGSLPTMLLRRAPWALLTVLAASLIAFSIMFFAPGNPAERILTAETGNEPTREAVLAFLKSKGLDQPFVQQYTAWMSNMLAGDLGTSLRTGNPVWEEFIDRFPATVLLAITALMFSACVGVTLGILAAVKKNSWLDSLGNVLASIGSSVPSFWLALLLVLLFSIRLGWLPSYGYGQAKNLVLPTIALGLHQVARLLRISRESMLDALGQDYVNAAYARGVGTGTVIWRHALRNAAVPILTQLGLDLGALLGGAVIVENIFGWPGIGSFMMSSVLSRDYTAIAGFVLIVAVIFVTINFAVDTLYTLLDPRIKPGARHHG